MGSLPVSPSVPPSHIVRSRPGPLLTVVATGGTLLAWAFGCGIAFLLLRFPTWGMLGFFSLGWILLLPLMLGARRIALALDPTEVVGGAARFQAVAIPVLLALLVPVVATQYVPGIRLSPLEPLPGRPTIAFSAHGLDGNFEIYLYRGDADHIERMTADPAFDRDPAISPDGNRIAFVSDRSGNEELYLLSVADPSSVIQLTTDVAHDLSPSWSPDGSQIAFASDRDGDFDIWTMNADGGDLRDVTQRSHGDDEEPAWSPDGTQIAAPRAGSRGSDIWIWPVAGGAPRNLTNGAVGFAAEPFWSSDGRRLALTGWAAGDADVYTIGADGTGLTRLTSERSQDWAAGWFDDDRYVSFVSSRPGFGFNFAYYVPATGGDAVLYIRA